MSTELTPEIRDSPGQVEISLYQYYELSQSKARRYFEAFNEAKFYLKQTRQELRRLVYRTVNNRRNLVLLLDTLPGSVESSQVTLLKALLHTMKDLTIETHEKLEAANEKYNSVHIASQNLKDVFAVKPQPRLSGRTRILNRDIDDAIDVLTEESMRIITWDASVSDVGLDIKRYPAEYMVKNEAIRNAFKTTLVDLERSAENYLDLNQLWVQIKYLIY